MYVCMYVVLCAMQMNINTYIHTSGRDGEEEMGEESKLMYVCMYVCSSA